MMHPIQRPLLQLCAIALPLCASAQLNMNASLTPAELVQNVLAGQGVQVFNVTYNGIPDPNAPQEGSGSFTAGATNLGIGQGLFLGSGFALSAAGPEGNFMSDNMANATSDPDLQLLSGGIINDASVLEFDFIPIGDSIRFNYVFGSEEYPEWVCSFNDVFGFFLSGPGINGGQGFEDDAINIALIPGSSTYVGVNTINNGDNDVPNDPICPAVNPEFYVNNDGGTTVVFDGFTVVLQAKAAVTCGEVHHIKLAIGDALDNAFDSGVFIEGGSFASAPFVPDLQPGPGIIGQDTILESCFNVEFLFRRLGDSTLAANIEIVVGGTATPGVDYNPPLPPSINFPPFQSEVPFALNVPLDPDGPETLQITIISDSPCTADSLAVTFDFIIVSPDPLIGIGEAFLIDCGESVQLTPSITGGYGAYDYAWITGSTASSILYTPTQVQDVTVLVTDTCGATTTAFFAVELSQPPPLTATLQADDPMYEGCSPATLTVTRPAGTSGDLLLNLVHLGAATSIADYDLGGTLLLNGGQSTGTYTVNPAEDGLEEEGEWMTVSVGYTNACQQTVSDTVTALIMDAPPIILDAQALLILPCGEDSVALTVTAAGGVGGSPDITWSNNYTGGTTWVSNTEDGVYTVTATDDCDRSVSQEITVDPQCAIVIPNVISPNGDGQNDVFFIDGILASRSSVRIYNRWGQLVYESANYRNTWNGGDLPDGTYFYEVRVDRDPEPYTGHVTILSNGRRR